MTFCFLPDSIAQQAHELSTQDDPILSRNPDPVGRRSRSAFHPASALGVIFRAPLPETIQNDVVVPKDGCEIVLAVSALGLIATASSFIAMNRERTDSILSGRAIDLSPGLNRRTRIRPELRLPPHRCPGMSGKR